ncbi:MAG: GNAT family N-acetyltransferase [Bacteroidetes bacterium]|nr:GNAT family N-acetyltransferase [Bacteroidota bacterium]HET6243966.1 hypothetical protein [Bacteroidia bacterium]
MIHFLEHNQIDKTKWNELIYNAHNGLIYAYSWYLDLVCPNWAALVNEDFTTVMPLPNNKKFGIDYLFPPFFVQQLGVFCLSNFKSQEVDSFIRAIPEKYKYIEILLNSENVSLEKKKGINLNNNLELQLHSNYEFHYKEFSENTRRSIVKAAKYNLQEVYLESPVPIIDLFRKNRGKGINNLKDKHYALFKKLCTACSENASIELIGIKEQDQLIAGAVYFIKKNRAIFIFSGTSNQAKQTRAMFFLIDNFIKRNAGSGMILDFEGSNNENLARFYKGFGASEKPYPGLKINRLPLLLKNFKK